MARLSDWIDPMPGPQYLAYARAVIAWGGGEPNEAAAVRFAKALAGTRGGATWVGLVELAGDDGDAEDATPPETGGVEFDPYRLTPPQMERMAELRDRVVQVGRDGLTEDEGADLAQMEAILLAPDPPERDGS